MKSNGKTGIILKPIHVKLYTHVFLFLSTYKSLGNLFFKEFFVVLYLCSILLWIKRLLYEIKKILLK